MPENQLPEEKRFSIIKRAESFTHAGRGIWVFLRSTHNAWIHLALLVCAVLMGFYFKISEGEWLALVLTCGFVLSAEAFNTAIEFHMNLTSPEHHPYAKDTKDIAAGAVLISAITAGIVGAIIFLPRIVGVLR